MSPLISRILLAVLMIPVALLLDLMLYLVIDSPLFGNDRTATWTSNLTAVGFIGGYWLLLWRRSVRWTPTRVQRTWLYAGAAMLTGAGAGWCVGIQIDTDVGIFVGSFLACFLWLLATLFIWRETPAETAERLSPAATQAIVCPTCGYNLTGLSEPRCPECGTKFTINELIASQPSRNVEIGTS